MTKYQAIAKAMLVMMGLYAVMSMIKLGIMFTQNLALNRTIGTEQIIQFVCLILTTGIFIAICFRYLLLKNQAAANRICPQDAESAEYCSDLWLATCLRLAVLLMGLLLLRRCLHVPFTFFGFLFHEAGLRRVMQHTVTEGLHWAFFKSVLSVHHGQIEDPIRFVTALYLICGAPHLIQYHLRHHTHRQLSPKETP
jgi:hypothetical protein